MSRFTRRLLLTLLVCFAATSAAHAQINYCWNLAGGEGWADDGSLWVDPTGATGSIPAGTDTAILRTPGLMKIDATHQPWADPILCPSAINIGDGVTSGYLTTPGEGHAMQSGGVLSYSDWLRVGYYSPGTSTFVLQDGQIQQTSTEDKGYSGLNVGFHATGSMTVSGAATSIAPLMAFVGVGEGAAASGTLTMSDNANLTCARLEVAHGSSGGAITGTASATVNLYNTASITNTGYTVLGIWNNSQGIVNLHDSSKLAVHGVSAADQHLVVGDAQCYYSLSPSAGVGVLNIGDNATVEADNLRIGNNKTGDGTINLSSAAGTANLVVGRIYHGYAGSKGVLNIDDGGVLTQTTSYWHLGYVGMNGAHGNGIVNMNGGVIDRTASTNYIAIGYLCADGTWNHNDGTLLNNGAGIIMGREDPFYGRGSNATVSLNGGIFESGWFRSIPSTL